jgi:DNA-binding NarL/FixJ family response regulator
MRAIMVGGRAERQGLRERLGELGHELQIVAEYESLAEARASGVSADAILLAPPAGASDPDEDIIAEPLTPREIEVLELVSLGLPNKAVAERLGISDQTVKFHVGSITAKLGAANRTDAVRRGVRQGLITL